MVGYPFSHNQVENHPKWKETIILEIHPLSTWMMGGRVSNLNMIEVQDFSNALRYIALLIGLAFWLERLGFFECWKWFSSKFSGRTFSHLGWFGDPSNESFGHLLTQTVRKFHVEAPNRYGSVYKQFVNLLWVLAGWFVFIAGAYIAVPWSISQRHRWTGSVVCHVRWCNLQMSNEQKPWLFRVYRGLYYPVINGDYNKPLEGSRIPMKQPV